MYIKKVVKYFVMVKIRRSSHDQNRVKVESPSRNIVSKARNTKKKELREEN